MDSVPRRPEGAPGPDEGVVLDRLGQDQVPARPQDPAGLGQHPIGLFEVVEHVDAPHQADAGVGERQGGPVGHGHRRLGQRFRGAFLVVFDPDRAQAGGPHPSQPVPPATAQIEHGAVAPQRPEMTFQPQVQRLVDIGGGMLAGARRKHGHRWSSACGSPIRPLANTIPPRPATPKTAPTHRAGPGSFSFVGACRARVEDGPPFAGATHAVGGPSPGVDGQVSGGPAGCAPAGSAMAKPASNAAAATVSRDVRMLTTTQSNLQGLSELHSRQHAHSLGGRSLRRSA